MRRQALLKIGPAKSGNERRSSENLIKWISKTIDCAAGSKTNNVLTKKTTELTKNRLLIYKCYGLGSSMILHIAGTKKRRPKRNPCSIVIHRSFGLFASVQKRVLC